MRHVVDNLTRQHRELVKVATEMFGWLDAGKLRRSGASVPFRTLSSLTGILNVHLAMEDRSLYPRLVQHPDLQLRTLAQRFLDERGQIAERYEAYRACWSSAAAIEADPAAFIDETRAILGLLWNRMKLEDDVLHPEIVRTFADQP
jgi:hypothetical protein